MFVTEKQIYVFIACVAMGGVAGAVFWLFRGLLSFFGVNEDGRIFLRKNNRINEYKSVVKMRKSTPAITFDCAYLVRAGFDVIFFVFLSFCYILFSYRLGFPSFRVYMPFGVLVGIYLYTKSFHIILAKTLKRLYNTRVKRKGTAKDDRTKV